jgi:hypothetical protein
MKHTSRTRLTPVAVLSLLLLLAFAVGAQAAAAAHFSNGSTTTTPAAGTQGRGGVDGATALAVAAAAEPLAGTQGRGGASLAQVPTTPPAGTVGRGGVAVFSTPGAASRSAGTVAFAFSRPRGAFLPVPQAGNVPKAVVAPGPMSSADWITLAIIVAFAAVAGAIMYSVSRRRSGQHEAALASYCTQHPTDPVCGAA